MSTPYRYGLHWFRHDLRLQDNEALVKLAKQCETFSLVYIFDPSWLVDDEDGFRHLGHHRHTFLEASLKELQRACQSNRLELIIIQGNPFECLTQLIEHTGAECVSYEYHAGYNERAATTQLKEKYPQLSFIAGKSNYLLEIDSLPFSIDDMPNVFSPFRRKVEKNLVTRNPIKEVPSCQQASSRLIKAIDELTIAHYIFSKEVERREHQGGEQTALDRIQEYFFKTDHIAEYKETRNGLDGWDFSSRFSSFLAHGCISPATIYTQLQEYENKRLKNDSTYWLFFELLWREFFHLQAMKHDKKLFHYGGIQNKVPLNKHDEHKFASWCLGNTSFDIVNACMKQLNETGFMSNRGRQLVASCFVHELGLDWRYGAKYFEQELIDFDVCSNYGNWQYLAGVGSDPRGHRQFNLQKQSDIYDPNRVFVNKWLA